MCSGGGLQSSYQTAMQCSSRAKWNDQDFWRAVDNHVLIYVHKEQELANVERLYPADHYVLVDDKLRILAAVKKIWREKVTTVFVKQGHYAFDSKVLVEQPHADVVLDRIGDLIELSLPNLLNA